MSDLAELLWASDAAKALTNEAARRIAALENACRIYLDAYDGATGTVCVEPVIRAVMKDLV